MGDEDPRGSGSRNAAEASFAAVLQRGVNLDVEESEIDVVPLPIVSDLPAVGDVLKGRYRVERMIAKGGVGVVLRATDLKLDRVVALKLLLPAYAKVEKARVRFELEARIAARIDSEHVPHVLDVGELDSGAQYMVMEYLTGEDLGQLLARRGKLPLEEAVELLMQTCEVVALAHAAAIVHRDLKPTNLFVVKRLDGSTCVKVLDFGLAKADSLAHSRGGKEPLTRSKLVGTPRYMAPEQIETARDVDGRADTWALGAILYELVAGVPAFEGKQVGQVLEKIRLKDPPSLRSVAPETPKALEAIVRRCLRRKAAERYESVGALARDLAKLVDSRHRTRGGVMAIVAIAALAAALAFAIWRGRGDDSAPPAQADASKVGEACSSAGSCGGLACVGGVCTQACTNQAGCTAPAKCTRDGFCATQLKVGFVYIGVPEDGGWTATHEQGRKEVSAKLAYVESDFVSDAHRPEAAEKAIDDFVARGFDVVIANSFSLREALAKKAKEHPRTKFLIYSYPPSPEVGAFGGRMEQAFYLAGFAAAQRSRSGRLGFVGSLVTPEVVRYINAFTRGARRHRAEMVVEVRWLGFWFDTAPPDAHGRHKEEVLAGELVATGCDVIAHNADNGRVVEALEAAALAAGAPAALSIGNNSPRACDRGKTSCLGSVAWNWDPVYAAVLEDIHRGQWSPSTRYHPSIRANPEQSVVNFVMNEPVAGSKLMLEVAPLLAEIATEEGSSAVFRGPYCSTGQREACVAAGASLSDDELRTMCWYVDGVVEKAPASPTAPGRSAPDRPALVPDACHTQQ